MQQALLDHLRVVTEEEQRILDGVAEVDKDLYTSGKDFTVDSAKMLSEGKLIAVRTRAGIVKEVQAFVAPKLFGGVAGKTPVEGIGVELPSEAVELKYTDICQIGEDIRIKCQVCDKKQEESCLQES